MNLREKGRSNLMVQRRSRREHNRFRPSRYPLPSPPDRICGKIQASTRQSDPEPAAGDAGAGRRRQALRFAIPCHRPFLLSRRSLAAVPAPFVDSFHPLQRKSSANCTPTSQPISSPKFAGFRPSPPTPSAATTPLR